MYLIAHIEGGLVTQITETPDYPYDLPWGVDIDVTNYNPPVQVGWSYDSNSGRCSPPWTLFEARRRYVKAVSGCIDSYLFGGGLEVNGLFFGNSPSQQLLYKSLEGQTTLPADMMLCDLDGHTMPVTSELVASLNTANTARQIATLQTAKQLYDHMLTLDNPDLENPANSTLWPAYHQPTI